MLAQGRVSRSDMVSIFRPSTHEPYRRMVGFECEVFCFDRATLTPLSYYRRETHQVGLFDVLQEAASYFQGTVDSSTDRPYVVYLDHGATISLEPGGQLEYSSTPQETFVATVDQYERYRRFLRHLETRFGLHVFYGAVTPVHALDEIGLNLTNPRYQLMNDYFVRLGSEGQRMMRQTSSLQLTFDYQDRLIGEDLLRTAMYVAPWVAGLLAHSPFLEGKQTDYLSYRFAIWQNTDPRRSGFPPGFTDEHYSFERYAEFVEQVPMLFIRRNHTLVDAKGMTFSEFNRQGFEGQFPTVDDFRLHNSTIFTEVRLKNTIELRSIDGQDPALFAATVALCSGLLLCPTARQKTMSLLSRFDAADYARVPEQLAKTGLHTQVRDRSAADIVRELREIAAKGVMVCFSDGEQAARALRPLDKLITEKKTPADYVREQFSGDAMGWLRAGRTFSDDQLT